jgi:hypothetical protein
MSLLDTTEPGLVSVRCAEGSEDIHQACRLRYAVLVEELGRRQYADDTNGIYRDRLDGGGSLIILAWSGETVVGTLRFTPRRSAAFLDEDNFLFSAILAGYNLAECAIADRGAILPAYRKHGLYPKLWEAGFANMAAQGVKYVFGVVDSDNCHLNEFHERQGWIFLHHRVPQGEHLWNLILKHL